MMTIAPIPEIEPTGQSMAEALLLASEWFENETEPFDSYPLEYWTRTFLPDWVESAVLDGHL
jgi:hypothetical protein